MDAVASRRSRHAGRFRPAWIDRILTSHVLDVVEKLCTHVGIIAKGRLVEQASLDEIRHGGSLEARFLEKVGADEAANRKLSWLDEEAV